MALKIPNWLDGLLTGAIGANKETVKKFVHAGLDMAYESCKFKASQTEFEFDDTGVEAIFEPIESWKRPTE